MSDTTGKIYKERFAKRATDHSLTPPFPENCLVELTNACNHECVFCANPRMNRKVSRLPLDIFKKFVNEAVPLGVKELGFYTTGDPLMTPNLHEYVQAATDAGVAYTYITTNGALGTPERFKKLIAAGLKSVKFSINAGSRETYKLVHGSDDFDKVVGVVRWLADYRKENKLQLRLLGSCVLTRATEGEKDAHQALFGPLFDDILYVASDGMQGQSIEQVTQIAPKFKPLSFPPVGSIGPCHMLWSRVHLTSEGYLTLCCVDYEDNLTYADVGDGQPLMSHWHNAVITEMRKKHINRDIAGTLCHKCYYGGSDPIAPLTALRGQADAPSARKADHLAKRIDVIVENNP